MPRCATWSATRPARSRPPSAIPISCHSSAGSPRWFATTSRRPATQFTAAINKERVKPWGDSSGDIGLYDWLEETYRRESELTGKPMPDHLTMLEGFGPKKARKRKAPDVPPPPGKRVELDGSSLAVDDEGDITITLPDGQITLAMWGGVYTVRVRGAELPRSFKGFREACEAVGDDRVLALADAALS